MAEPFQIVGAAVALVATVWKVSSMTKDFVDSIRGAPRAVNVLSDNISGLAIVLETLWDFLLDLDSRRYPEQARCAQILQSPLKNCETALQDITNDLRPFVKPDGGLGTSKWKAAVWAYREKDVLTLQRILLTSQASLDSAIAVVHLSNSSRELRGIRRQIAHGLNHDGNSIGDSSFAGSSVVQSDRGHALRRFLLRGETIYETFSPEELAGEVSNRSSRLESLHSGRLGRTTTNGERGNFLWMNRVTSPATTQPKPEQAVPQFKGSQQAVELPASQPAIPELEGSYPVMLKTEDSSSATSDPGYLNIATQQIERSLAPTVDLDRSLPPTPRLEETQTVRLESECAHPGIPELEGSYPDRTELAGSPPPRVEIDAYYNLAPPAWIQVQRQPISLSRVQDELFSATMESCVTTLSPNRSMDRSYHWPIS